MIEKEIQESVLGFLRSSILFDENREILADQSFLESGILDSTGILELIQFLEEKFPVTFADVELTAVNFDSLNRVSRFVADKLRASQRS